MTKTSYCPEHKTELIREPNGYWCKPKLGPGGHPSHWLTLELKPRPPAPEPKPGPAPSSTPPSAPTPQPAQPVETLPRWKAVDGSGSVLWLHVLAPSKSGSHFRLRWQLNDGKRLRQGYWTTAPNEMQAALELTKAIEAKKAEGWVEALQGPHSRIELRPIPTPDPTRAR